MGTQLGSIIKSKEITYEELAGKKFVVDAFNNLYQYLTTIRQYDGTPLKDSQGNITSHLSGLFFRTSNLMKKGLKLAFVFDGVAPDLKKEERERRKALKDKARKQYQQAVESRDVEMMAKYAGRAAVLSDEMIKEAKFLLDALGCPVIQAPSEGEAQAASMVANGDAHALISQDTDGLLFGATRIVKNLTISQKKRINGISVTVRPEIIELQEILNDLGIDRDQLIVLGILNGTDFDPGGVKGIGPKKALALVKEHGKNFERIFKDLNWEFQQSWNQVFDCIRKIPVKKDYVLEWNPVNRTKIMKLLIDKHDFSRERVEKAIEDIADKQSQKGLSDFF